MSLAAKRAAAEAAEATCVQARADAVAALHHVRDETLRSATPARIVVAGLALGFVAGRAAPAAGAGARALGGPLFELATQTVLPGLLAGVTAWSESVMAGIAAGEDAAGEADPDEATDAAAPDEDPEATDGRGP